MLFSDEILRIQKMRDINFEELMRVYVEGNTENGQYFYPYESEAGQLRLAEQDFYDYLQNDFFCVNDAQYWILVDNGCYVSALRTEPFQDGYLLQALETVPSMRRRGYATRLLRYVVTEIQKMTGLPVYSHVSKRNVPSITVHERCGFMKSQEYAVYLDGTVSSTAFTFVFR